MVEDAISGVQAGAAGDFALVIGVDRGVGADALRLAGADVVVDDLAVLALHGLSRTSPRDPLDRSRFPVDEWSLVEIRFDPEDLGVTESLFSVGNGYLGLRGNYEESRDASTPRHLHQRLPRDLADPARRGGVRLRQVGQTIVNVPDAKVIRLYVDDEPLHLSTADLLEYERCLDFRTGVLSRRSCGVRRAASGSGSTAPGWCRSPSSTSR